MTVEQLERGQRLLRDINDYERRLRYAECGEIVIRYGNSEERLTEDIYQELVIAQLKKRFEFSEREV